MDPLLPEGLDGRAGFWLREVSNELHERFSAELARYEITPPLWAILLTLYREEAKTPAGLVRRLHADPAAVTRRLDRLQRMGLVRRTRSRRDRRSVGLALTDSGRDLVPRLSDLSTGIMETAFADISKADRTRLIHLLQRMLQNLEAERLEIDAEPSHRAARR